MKLSDLKGTEPLKELIMPSPTSDLRSKKEVQSERRKRKASLSDIMSKDPPAQILQGVKSIPTYNKPKPAVLGKDFEQLVVQEQQRSSTSHRVTVSLKKSQPITSVIN